MCTEVIYRAYDGLADLTFPLTYRVGRPNLSGEDLIKMACQGHNFRLICCYAPRFAPALLHHDAILPIVTQALAID